MAAYEQFLSDERLKAIDQLQQLRDQNQTSDFVAAQQAQASSELQYQKTATADNLAMLNALQNGNNLATLLSSQNSGNNDLSSSNSAFQASNAYLNVATLLQLSQQSAATGTTDNNSLASLLATESTYNTANTLFQEFGTNVLQDTMGLGTFDLQTFTNANNTYNNALDLLLSQIQTNAIYGLLSMINVSTVGTAPATTTAP